jgi:hypothetical protein
LAVTVTGSPAFTVAGLAVTLPINCAWAVAHKLAAKTAAEIQEIKRIRKSPKARRRL